MSLILGPILSILGWGFYLMPEGLKKVTAGFLGFLLRMTGHRSSVIQQNLRYAFPDSRPDAAQKRDLLARSFYDHLARVVLEVLMVFGPMGRYARKFSEVQGVENWIEANRLGKGVLVLSSHVGNWEVMAAIGAQVCKMDLLLVTKRVKPKWFHELLEKSRLSYGVPATYEPRTFRDVLSYLKKGKTVGFVLDQYAGPPIGIRVPFFGVPAGTATALAALAKRTGAPVLPVVVYRRSDGVWGAEIGKPIPWQSDEDLSRELALNTALYAREIERHVLAHPEQWIWSHRRFKGDLSPIPPDEWNAGRARA